MVPLNWLNALATLVFITPAPFRPKIVRNGQSMHPMPAGCHFRRPQRSARGYLLAYMLIFCGNEDAILTKNADLSMR
jgi:hypothetical protein